MNEIIARKVKDENGDEIIELDLNKPWPKKSQGYNNYMDEVGKLMKRKTRKKEKEFITILS
jgi:hypothetical protein